jgi:hypothetical protein
MRTPFRSCGPCPSGTPDSRRYASRAAPLFRQYRPWLPPSPDCIRDRGFPPRWLWPGFPPNRFSGLFLGPEPLPSAGTPPTNSLAPHPAGLRPTRPRASHALQPAPAGSVFTSAPILRLPNATFCASSALFASHKDFKADYPAHSKAWTKAKRNVGGFQYQAVFRSCGLSAGQAVLLTVSVRDLIVGGNGSALTDARRAASRHPWPGAQDPTSNVDPARHTTPTSGERRPGP